MYGKKLTDFLNNISNTLQPILNYARKINFKKDKPERDFVAERKLIATLIFDVLVEKKTIKEALLGFPKDLSDESAITAYHALIHFESDEDLRKEDNLYAQVQDDYILYIAETLQKGEALPKNITNAYHKFYRWSPSLFSNTKEGIWAKLKRDINI